MPFTAEELHAMERDGVLLVPNLLRGHDLDAVRAAVLALERTETAFAAGWPRFAEQSAEYAAVARLYSLRPLLGLVEQLVGGPAQCTGGEMLDKSEGDDDEAARGNWGIQCELCPPTPSLPADPHRVPLRPQGIRTRASTSTPCPARRLAPTA